MVWRRVARRGDLQVEWRVRGPMSGSGRTARPLGSRWELRYPALLAVFGLAAFLFWSGALAVELLLPLQRLTAAATGAVLGWGGLEAAREGTILRHPAGFGFEISAGCAAVIPTGIYAAAVLAFPVRGRLQARGMIIGLPLLLGLNLLRLAHLFHLGVFEPEVFSLAHKVIWQSGILLAVFLVWVIWARWAHESEAAGARQPSVTAEGREASIPPAA